MKRLIEGYRKFRKTLWPAERVRAGTLDVDGARFGITNGVLEVLNKETARFESVEHRPFPFNLSGRAA